MIRLTRMTRLILSLSATILLAVTARAEMIQQTFVSATGNNNNSCERTSPCRTFSGALQKTEDGGEIIVLDAGEYGPVAINKSVRITATGIYAGIIATGGAGNIAVTISGSPYLAVVLKGLTITGKGAATGVSFSEGNTLHIEGCTISGFTAKGISFTSEGNLFVKDSIVRNNNNNGIYIASTSKYALTSIDHTRMERNGYGVRADGGSGKSSQVTIRDSVAADNTAGGFYAVGNTAQINVIDSEAVYNGGSGFYAASGGKINAQHCLSANNATNGFLASSQGTVSVKDCTVTTNTGNGVVAQNSGKASVEGSGLVNNLSSGLLVSGGATALISGTMVTGNNVGLKNDSANPGTLKSFGNNQVSDNTTNTQGTITPAPLS
jgi:hypothetical protein